MNLRQKIKQPKTIETEKLELIIVSDPVYESLALYLYQALTKAPPWILTGTLIVENYIFTLVSLEGNLIRIGDLATITPHAKHTHILTGEWEP